MVIKMKEKTSKKRGVYSCHNIKPFYICTRFEWEIKSLEKVKLQRAIFFEIFFKKHCRIKKQLYICTR